MEQLRVNLRIGLRAGSTKALLVFGLLFVLLSVTLGALSARQPTTLSVDFGFSVLRILLCVLALVWMQEFLGRSIERRFIHQLLVFPQPRFKIITSAFVSVALLLALVAILLALLLMLAALAASSYQQLTPVSFGYTYWLTWLYVYLDILVVVAFSVVVIMVSTTPYFALVLSIAFYIIGHALVSIINMLQLSPYADASHQSFILPILNVLRLLIPDLSAFDLRDWALYGESVDVNLLLTQTSMGLVYIALLLMIATLLFNRREFS